MYRLPSRDRSYTNNGNGAPLRAAVRAERCRKVGDGEGAAVWLRVLKAVEELLAEKPEGGAMATVPSFWKLLPLSLAW